jgi:hypothetical protein
LLVRSSGLCSCSASFLPFGSISRRRQSIYVTVMV